ncbi:serine/threonine-protein kinase [Serinibacter arcticus]|uniref:non-specific serine/threonine protein kinase n=1 Tax=Serinibacter arcticus TaxID=1655435 RepID=A0A4Z1DYZ9_9MICO|nr:serine/threonine-protein kinase [Serinibacter arcticus]TGO04230.1 putative serine/threonine-protein kinase pknK [Serinibacter arcticus]
MVDDDDAWAPAPRDDLALAVGVEPTPTATVTPAVATGVATTITVPGYTDLVEIARGGDGVVLRARDLAVDREVAIKVVDLAEPEVRSRFEREVALTVRLGRAHPHIVTVLATPETTEGRPCLVMDFHDLGSLHDRLRSHGPLPVAEVVAAGTAIADALAYAHAQGVLHRDVKPQNVLVLPTSYVLADFGIARMVDAGRTASLERFSYRHASPQVLDGLTPTPADDVWSLGSTLFTLLDGRAPFAADDPDEDTALAYLRKVRTGDRRRLVRDDVPPSLVALLEACLAPDTGTRPDGAAAVLAALRAVPTEDRGWDPAQVHGVSADAGGRDVGRGDGDGDADATRERSTAVAATPAPSPRAAAPVARSALSHLAAAPAPSPSSAPTTRRPASVPADEDVTGLAPDDAPNASAPTPTRSAGSGSTGRRVAAFLGGALLVGAAIGVGPVVVDMVRGGDAPQGGQNGSTSPADPRTGTSGPGTPDGGTDVATGSGETVTTGAIPEYVGTLLDESAQAATGNPDLAATGLAAVDRGTSAEITWNAPPDEAAQVLVASQVEGGPIVAYDLLEAGTTAFVAEGLDPGVRVCFAVVGIGTVDGALDQGASASRCLER